MPVRLLLWIEPHPVRNYFEEFYDPGLMLANGLNHVAHEIQFQIFSNDSVIDRLSAASRDIALCCQRPTMEEAKAIAAFDGYWDQERIDIWRNLVRGEGPACDFYYSILARLHANRRFDGILLWSENGAVRRFANDNSLFTLHGELGPTRPPFPKTVYLDRSGTNGNASVLKTTDLVNAVLEPIQASAWHALSAPKDDLGNAPGIRDAGLTFRDSSFVPPHHPYVFIPLQLADDLNTLEHSSFASPEAFLREVLPPLLAQGLAVVVKGHPAASARAINLLAETRALSFAEALEDVYILPRDASAETTINIIQQASYVLTINSSVGYEALLMDKKVITLGRAIYDIGGKLQKQVSDLADLSTIQFDVVWTDSLTTFLNAHYFIPIKAIEDGSALLSAINCAPLRDREAAFWGLWCQSFSFAHAWAGLESVESAASPVTASSIVWRGSARRVNVATRHVTIVSEVSGETAHAAAKLSSGIFSGWVENVTRFDDKRSALTGWAATKADSIPPVAVMLIRKDQIVALVHALDSREDVQKYLGRDGTNRFGFTLQATDLTTESAHEFSVALVAPDNTMEFWPVTHPAGYQ